MKIFRNYEGVISRYIEPEGADTFECPPNCDICEQRKARGLDTPPIGLEKMLSGDVVSFEPKDLARRKRGIK